MERVGHSHGYSTPFARSRDGHGPRINRGVLYAGALCRRRPKAVLNQSNKLVSELSSLNIFLGLYRSTTANRDNRQQANDRVLGH